MDYVFFVNSTLYDKVLSFPGFHFYNFNFSFTIFKRPVDDISYFVSNYCKSNIGKNGVFILLKLFFGRRYKNIFVFKIQCMIL